MRAADVLGLAGASLRASGGRTALLVGALAVLFFLPAAVALGTSQLEHALLARAEASPLLIGPVGSRFDTALAALYFRGRTDRKVPYRALALVEDPGYGLAVPLHTEHTAQGIAVVGTSPDYLRARGLQVAAGRRFALIGEVVVGARVAAAFGIEPGDRLRADRRNLTDLSAPSSATLEVVGVLSASATPDDEAAFTDVKTTWWLDGYYHGHGEVAAPDDPSTATFLFTEPDEARASIHLHGDEGTLPLTAVLVVPRDRRAHDQLLGDLAGHAELEAVRPAGVVDDVLQVVGRLELAFQSGIALVGASALALLVLVVVLTLRLRQSELDLLAWLGASRGQIVLLVGTELAITLLAAAGVAAAGVAVAVAVLERMLPG